jgi:2-dehydropantoate 2-reductase
MRITVFGAGAVGGHLAARLAASGAAVSAVARGVQLEAIAARGITLLIDDDRIVGRLPVTDRPETLGSQDAVIVTLKASGLAGIAPALEPLLGPETTVVFAMNGIPWWYLHGVADGERRPDLSRLDPGGELARVLGLERVLGCVINSANEIVEPGVVRNAPLARNRFILGEPDGRISARARRIAALLERAGLEAPIVPRIREAIWTKLVQNMATSPICALTGEAIGVVGRHPELLAVGKALLNEGLAVAAAAGFPIDMDPDAAFRPRLRSTHKSSMLQDLERGRPPEIDAILTAPQAFARAARVATPHLDAVTALVIEKARKTGLYPASQSE